MDTKGPYKYHVPLNENKPFPNVVPEKRDLKVIKFKLPQYKKQNKEKQPVY